jgi:hypothetical protein
LDATACRPRRAQVAAMSGAKIIKGLKQALAGDFTRVTIKGQTWVRVPGWQPIASAPKDGTRILVPYEGHTRVAAWGKTSHVPLYGFCLADQGVEDFDLVTVELWQPLPVLPEV